MEVPVQRCVLCKALNVPGKQKAENKQPLRMTNVHKYHSVQEPINHRCTFLIPAMTKLWQDEIMHQCIHLIANCCNWHVMLMLLWSKGKGMICLWSFSIPTLRNYEAGGCQKPTKAIESEICQWGTMIYSTRHLLSDYLDTMGEVYSVSVRADTAFFNKKTFTAAVQSRWNCGKALLRCKPQCDCVVTLA